MSFVAVRAQATRARGVADPQVPSLQLICAFPESVSKRPGLGFLTYYLAAQESKGKYPERDRQKLNDLFQPSLVIQTASLPLLLLICVHPDPLTGYHLMMGK